MQSKGKLKASALAYSILISLILSLITLSMMTAMQLHQHRISNITDVHQGIRNAQSGIELMLADHNLGSSGPLSLDLFGEGTDSIIISRRPWGGFEVLYSKSIRGTQATTKCVLSGNLVSDSLIALTLVDNGKPLSLCGSTRINGNCALPKAGVKRAYIEGKNYIGKELIYGLTHQAPSSLPPVNYSSIENHLLEETESVQFEDIPTITLDRSFQEPLLHVTSSEYMDLSSMIWSGYILATSESEIFIGSGARLSRCILSAPKITIASGFRGDVQLYGDSIFIGAEARLDYPSGIYNENGYVEFKKGAVLIGQVIINLANDQQPSLSIDNDAAVYGFVSNQGLTQLKGAVHGQLETNGFTLKTPSAYYENHLLDATISSNDLPRPFVSYVQPTGKREVITPLQ